MKFICNRAIAFFLISSAFLLAAAGCKKSSNNNGGSGTMSATVNGTAWANNYPVVGVYATSGSSGTFELIGLQFKSGDSTSLALDFVSPIVLNQPISTNTSSLIAAYTDSKSGAGYGALLGLGNATVTITSYDSTGHSIGGTFNGVLYNEATLTDSITVTNGKFSSSFTVN
ncbi:MAG TPA: hypothetical protein VKR41_07905 [Puia sp.]|nr:hypothetical protein [Puia sp.]